MQITKNQKQRVNLKGDQNESHFTYRRARIKIKTKNVYSYTDRQLHRNRCGKQRHQLN